jgi:hypothetical protein
MDIGTRDGRVKPTRSAVAPVERASREPHRLASTLVRLSSCRVKPLVLALT